MLIRLRQRSRYLLLIRLNFKKFSGIVRLLPEVVGNNESIHTDSFQEPLLEYNQYTRPQKFHSLEVPEILRSGNHEKINNFRLKQSIEITKKRRPDVWAKYVEKKLLG